MILSGPSFRTKFEYVLPGLRQARRKEGGCTGCTCTLSFLGEKIVKIPYNFL